MAVYSDPDLPEKVRALDAGFAEKPAASKYELTQAEFENQMYGKFDRLAELERAVIEAAVKWRTVYDADSRYALDRAIDTLLKSREK